MSAASTETSPLRNKTRTISVASGKGGVGKTTLIANLALHLAGQGNKVLILDGDLGMANVDIMYGVRTTRNIESVLLGECSLREIIVEVSPNVYLIPGGSGVYGMQNLTMLQKKTLLDQVNDLDDKYDYML